MSSTLRAAPPTSQCGGGSKSHSTLHCVHMNTRWFSNWSDCLLIAKSLRLSNFWLNHNSLMGGEAGQFQGVSLENSNCVLDANKGAILVEGAHIGQCSREGWEVRRKSLTLKWLMDLKYMVCIEPMLFMYLERGEASKKVENRNKPC